jgi:two-component sensor histidine kinase
VSASLLARRPTGRAAERLERARRDDRHRLKNALHLIASLLNLQGGRLADGPARRELDAAVERVAILGTIYGRLLLAPDAGRRRTGTPATVPARHLIGELVRELVLGHPDIAVEAAVADTALSIERAVAIGLIVRELVSNSLRHGFDGARAGQRVVVRLARAGRHAWRLSVADNGRGLASPAPATGFGLTLVALMVEQLRGTHACAVRSGTCHTIRYADPPEQPRSPGRRRSAARSRR